MTYKQFCNDVFDSIRSNFGDDFSVSLNEVTKNNGTILNGIVIKNHAYNIAPTFYLNPLFLRFGNDVVAASKSILESYYENAPTQSFPMNLFSDWQMVKDKIIYRVVNAELNRSLLSHCPHFLFHDLAVVYVYLLNDNATISIRNEHLDLWDVTSKDLWCIAQENIEKLCPHTVVPMSKVLADMVKAEDILKLDDCMFVASNDKNLFGASVMADHVFLERFAEDHGDFVILPSSVHECIFLVNMKEQDLELLNSYVRSVNEEVVLPEEVLASHAYFFDSKKKKIVF